MTTTVLEMYSGDVAPSHSDAAPAQRVQGPRQDNNIHHITQPKHDIITTEGTQDYDCTLPASVTFRVPQTEWDVFSQCGRGHHSAADTDQECPLVLPVSTTKIQ